MLLHAIQVLPQYQYKKYEFEKFVNLSDQGETTQAFPVVVSLCRFTETKWGKAVVLEIGIW